MVEEHPKMKAAGHHYTEGAWLYGGYKDHIPGVDSAHNCADTRETDAGFRKGKIGFSVPQDKFQREILTGVRNISGTL